MTSYRNSNGDVVGTKIIRFAINGVLYYAPGKTTALEGQAASTGVLDTNPDITTALSVPQAASLQTDYGSLELQQAINTNSLLLEHTRQNHDAVHNGGRMRVVAKETLDSGGYIVGRYVIKFVVNGVEYEIPCDTRIGGPPEPVKGSNLLSNVAAKHNISYMNADDNQYATFYLTEPTAGTKPYTATYQINDATDGSASGSWVDLTDTTAGFHGAFGYAGVVSYNITFAGRLSLKAGYSGDDQQLVCTVRVKYDSPFGTAYTNWGQFYAKESDGCGFIGGPDTNGYTSFYAIPGSPPIT